MTWLIAFRRVVARPIVVRGKMRNATTTPDGIELYTSPKAEWVGERRKHGRLLGSLIPAVTGAEGIIGRSHRWLFNKSFPMKKTCYSEGAITLSSRHLDSNYGRRCAPSPHPSRPVSISQVCVCLFFLKRREEKSEWLMLWALGLFTREYIHYWHGQHEMTRKSFSASNSLALERAVSLCIVCCSTSFRNESRFHSTILFYLIPTGQVAAFNFTIPPFQSAPFKLLNPIGANRVPFVSVTKGCGEGFSVVPCFLRGSPASEENPEKETARSISRSIYKIPVFFLNMSPALEQFSAHSLPLQEAGH